jgi:hypothetical protein
MEKKWIAQAEDTIQVTEDEWRRIRISLELKPETTVLEIITFFAAKKVDLKTGILLLDINIPQP